ncbi:hypothetical protein B9Z55_021589 [Caenorhabditis nigoni]|nr:hypothetical protein B9Z55_021589 [Caenorhabditis nigoni]
MEIDELIAFSLCSKRTKTLVKDAKIPIEPIHAQIYQNYIILKIRSSNLREAEDESYSLFIYVDFSNPWIELDRKNGMEVWRKEGFTQSDFIAHFLNVFNISMIHALSIENIEKPFLDTVKQIIPKFNKLKISSDCSNDVAKMAFSNLSPIATKEVAVHQNLFDNENDFSKFLTRNLECAFFIDYENSLELLLNDLLVANIDTLYIINTKITEKELNRFLKLWMKGSHRFYRPKYIKLSLEKKTEHEEVFRGIKCDIGNHERRLKRADGKELLISILLTYVIFEFQ